MIIDRRPEDDFGIIRVLIYPDQGHKFARTRHEVTCADLEYDHATQQRVAPTARVSLLGRGAGLCFEDVRRLADDYAVIADIAMRLEAERRAAYAERFGA